MNKTIEIQIRNLKAGKEIDEMISERMSPGLFVFGSTILFGALLTFGVGAALASFHMSVSWDFVLIWSGEKTI